MTINDLEKKQMTINDLEKAEMTIGLAYFIGLAYPFYKESTIDNKTAILGSINHNSNKVDEEDLKIHRQLVEDFIDISLDKNNSKIAINILDNTDKNIQSNKSGFTLTLCINKGIDTEFNGNLEKILRSKVNDISISNDDNIKSFFARGCFDGRSSVDKNGLNFRFLSLDIDSDDEKQELLQSIFSSLSIDTNINKRSHNYGKNDQLRINPNSIKYFMSKVGLFSKHRVNELSNINC